MAEYTPKETSNLVLFSLILIFGTIGNLLVIYVYGFTASRRFIKFERLMLLLGVFDLVASISNPAYYIYKIVSHDAWHLGKFGCKVIPALGPIFTSISLGIILIMAIDRDRAVATPLKTQFKLRTIYKGVAVNIGLCILVTIPYIHHTTYLEAKKTYPPSCFVDSTYSYDVILIFIFLTSDLIFLLVFSVTTFRIFKKLTSKDSIDCPKMRHNRAKETNRILKIIAAMGIMFIVCVFPRDLLLVSYSLKSIYPPQIPRKVAVDANQVLKILHTSSSCVNVILYSLLNKKFRREIIRLATRKKTLKNNYWSRYRSRQNTYDYSYKSTFNASFANSTFERQRQNGSRNVTRALLKHVLTKHQFVETRT